MHDNDCDDRMEEPRGMNSRTIVHIVLVAFFLGSVFGLLVGKRFAPPKEITMQDESHVLEAMGVVRWDVSSMAANRYAIVHVRGGVEQVMGYIDTTEQQPKYMYVQVYQGEADRGTLTFDFGDTAYTSVIKGEIPLNEFLDSPPVIAKDNEGYVRMWIARNDAGQFVGMRPMRDGEAPATPEMDDAGEP